MQSEETLRDLTMDLAIAFSEIEQLPRMYLMMNKKSFEILKVKELTPKHFAMVMRGQIIVVDIKSQQVFDNEKHDWEAIKEELSVSNTNKRKNGRVGRGNKNPRSKRSKRSSHNTKARRGKGTK
jgi:hypothetical protein